MTRRISADAKIVLERAGYIVDYCGYGKTNTLRLQIVAPEGREYTLMIDGGTVNNVHVVRLLNAVGCDEYGYKKRPGR